MEKALENAVADTQTAIDLDGKLSFRTVRVISSLSVTVGLCFFVLSLKYV